MQPNGERVDVPENAPAHCPGTGSDEAGRAAACEGCPNQVACATAPRGPDPDAAATAARLSSVRHRLLVLSGKGGVGKSTVAAQLALALASQGAQVGLLDVDICGPSIPRMMGLEGEEVHSSGSGWSPVYVDDRLAVMSIGFLLPSKDDAVIWRGPRKNGLIKQFLKDVDWGSLDFLIIDSPPGTSDEHISLAQYLQCGDKDGAIIVTGPQEVALADVRKELNFCRKVGMPVVGVVENMSRLAVPLSATAGVVLRDASTGEDVTARVAEALAKAGLGALVVEAPVFHADPRGAEAMCGAFNVEMLGRVPMDPAMSRAGEEGRSVLDEAGAPSAGAVREVVARVAARVGWAGAGADGQG